MIDIAEITTDIKFYDSSVKKAENVLSTQLGTLDYAPDFGIDMNFFLSERFRFQNEAFRAYLIKRLAEHSINVSEVTTQVNSLYEQNTINLAADNNSSSDELITR